MAKKNPKFVADSMLGSIARKLRIFGFDTVYVADADDDEILKIGIDQQRVIVTADRELFKRAIKMQAAGVLVSSDSEVDNLVHIMSRNGISTVDTDGIGSRCSVCNGKLETRKKEEVKGKIPEHVAAIHVDFFQCIDCGKIYWEGSHLKRIRSLAVQVGLKLKQRVATDAANNGAIQS